VGANIHKAPDGATQAVNGGTSGTRRCPASAACFGVSRWCEGEQEIEARVGQQHPQVAQGRLPVPQQRDRRVRIAVPQLGVGAIGAGCDLPAVELQAAVA